MSRQGWFDDVLVDGIGWMDRLNASDCLPCKKCGIPPMLLSDNLHVMIGCEKCYSGIDAVNHSVEEIKQMWNEEQTK